MKAITLHDKYDEEIIGTVLLKPNVNYDEVSEAWDEYQIENNTNLNMPDIDEFCDKYPELCDKLELDFYQPG